MRVVVAFILFSAIPASALDFTPYKESYEVEGIRFESVAFRENGKRILYSPPKQWSLSGGLGKLTLFPPGAALASATIQSILPSQLLPVERSNIQTLGELARHLVPKDAVKVEIGPPKSGSMGIGGREVSELELTYSLFLQPLQVAVFILPRGEEFVVFQLVARPSDYPTLAKEFRDSLHTFQGL
jgi:hypothetical protein